MLVQRGLRRTANVVPTSTRPTLAAANVPGFARATLRSTQWSLHPRVDDPTADLLNGMLIY